MNIDELLGDWNQKGQIAMTNIGIAEAFFRKNFPSLQTSPEGYARAFDALSKPIPWKRLIEFEQSMMSDIIETTGLYAVLDAVVDRYFPIVKNLEAEFERLEDRVFGEDAKDISLHDIPREQLTRRLYHLRREVVRFRGMVEPLLEVTIKLFGGRVPALCDGLGEYYRDIHDHLVRIVARLDALYATMGSAVQAQLALTTIEEGKVTKRLAAYASIFAADTLWVGLWGMNFKHMPELDWKYGYPFALAIIAVTSVVLHRQFRKRGWL